MGGLRPHWLRRATATVEVALVMPVLMLLVFGLLEYGWLFLTAEHVTNAARRGARLAVTPDATAADVREAVDSLMDDAGLGGSGYTVTISPADPTTVASGDPIEVTVSVAYHQVSLTRVPLLPVPERLAGTVTMAKEGP